MLKYMNNRSAGFTAPEMMVSLIVAGTFLLAFYQLFNATNTVAQITSEEAIVMTQVINQSERARYYQGSASEAKNQRYVALPGVRSASGAAAASTIEITNEAPVDITATLKKADISIRFAGDKTIKSSTFVRYGGGIFYGN